MSTNNLEILASIIIDGNSLGATIGYDYHAVTWVLRNVESIMGSHFKATVTAEALARGEGAPISVDPTVRPAVRCPAKGRIFFFSRPTTTGAAQPNARVNNNANAEIISAARTEFATNLAERSGWNVVNNNNNNTPNQQQQEATDAEMIRSIEEKLQPDYFDPIGPSASRRTATDLVVVVTGRQDRLKLLRHFSSKLSRVWCFVTRESRTAELEDWGKETGRLFALSLPQTPTSTIVAVASNNNNINLNNNNNHNIATAAVASNADDNNLASPIRRQPCPNFETCADPRCLLRHGDNRRSVCSKQLECTRSDCPHLHYSVHVRGIRGGPVSLNKLAPTQGKRRALTSLGWPLPLCPFGAGATCAQGDRCTSLHFADEDEAMTRAATGAVLNSENNDANNNNNENEENANLIHVDGIPVLFTKLEMTEGLKEVLNNKNNNNNSNASPSSCPEHNNYSPPRCTLGEKCKKIHFKSLFSTNNNNTQQSTGMGRKQDSSKDGTEDLFSYYAASSSYHRYGRNAPSSSQQQQNQLLGCVVCADEFAPSFGVCCNDNLHFTCDECLSSFISIAWSGLAHDTGDVPEVRCPAVACFCPLTDVQVARHTTEEACKIYLERRQASRDSQAAARAMALAQEMIRAATLAAGGGGGAAAAPTTTTTTTASAGETANAANPLPPAPSTTTGPRSAAEKELWKQQLRGMFPNGLMCPECLWGPVSFTACSDLSSHNGEERDGGVTVSNACRLCGFFGSARSDWLRWDGVPRLSQEEVDEAKQEAEANAYVHGAATAVPRLNAPDDADGDDDAGYDEDGEITFKPAWEMTPAEIRAAKRRKLANRYGMVPAEQLPPVAGPWIQATSGQFVIIYHVSGTVQIVFQRNSNGWVFAMRTPKTRQQTLYTEGLFFADGCESRAVAMELNRNYRTENLANHVRPTSFFEGLCTISELPITGCLRLDINTSSTASASATQAQRQIQVILQPNGVVMPFAQLPEQQSISCTTNPVWYMYNPLMTRREERILNGQDEETVDDDDENSNDDDNGDESLATDVVLVHRSGDVAIALCTSSNGWFNFRDAKNPDRERLCFANQGGTTAIQARASLNPTLIPRPSQLVPVHDGFVFGAWRISRDTIQFGEPATVTVVLEEQGFSLRGTGTAGGVPVRFKCTEANDDLTRMLPDGHTFARLDLRCESFWDEMPDISKRSAGPASAVGSNNGNNNNPNFQPSKAAPTPLPPRIHEKANEDDVLFFTEIVGAFTSPESTEGKRILANKEEIVTRFRTTDEAVRFAQYCVEFRMDPTLGESYSAFASSVHAGAPAATATNNTNVNNNRNGNDDDDDFPRNQNNNNTGFGPQLPPTSPNTGTATRSTTGGNSNTTSSSSSSTTTRLPTEEELNNVMGISGESKAVATFALRNFNNDVEQAVQYLFYCVDSKVSDPMSAGAVMGFKRVLHRQQQPGGGNAPRR